MGTAGRLGRLLLSGTTGDAKIDILQVDSTAWRERLKGLVAEPFIGRVLDSLPPATADDFGRVDRAERLRTPEAWQEWLGEYTGCEAWAESPAGFEKVPETNFMARAEVGDTTNGYVKTGETRDGLDVWRKQ